MTVVPARTLLWISFISTPLLWLLHFLLAYLITEGSCSAAGENTGIFGASSLTLLYLLTFVFVLASVFFTFLAFRTSKQAQKTAPSYDDFLPKLGFTCGLLFSFVVLLEFIPLAILGAC
ncbi:MAG: hypothetical protein KC422_23015 [Trueperaceae bacterium]|nr:hypothetical protein [Trueperaceae bacterium]